MKLTAFVFTLLALNLTNPKIVRAQDQVDSQDPSTQTVQELMEDFKSLFRKISSDVSKNQLTESTTEKVDALIAVSQIAAQKIPGSFDHLPESQRLELQVKYQEAMAAFILKLQELKVAVVANDVESAKKLVSELGQMRLSSHEQFRRP